MPPPSVSARLKRWKNQTRPSNTGAATKRPQEADSFWESDMTDEHYDFDVRGLLCDSCVVPDGKLYILGGGWTSLTPPAYPASVGRIAVALTVEIPYEATDQTHQLAIQLIDVNEQPHPSEVHIEGQLSIGRPAELTPGEPQTLCIGVHFDQVKFEEPGRWSFKVSLNGHEVERLAFQMLPATA
jgi:hypothetical protein